MHSVALIIPLIFTEKIWLVEILIVTIATLAGGQKV